MSLEMTFKVLSDPNRRKILEILKSGSKNAGEIASHFKMREATISYHLNKLKEAGLIEETREENFIYYNLSTSLFEDLILWIKQFDSEEEGVLNEN